MTEDFTIAIDTREQLPYDFARFDVQTVRQTLRTGDYAVADLPAAMLLATGDAVEASGGDDAGELPV